MSWSISSPAILIQRLATIPPSEMTATSVVPPPMSTIMQPAGSVIGSPAPIAAAIGSSISQASRVPRSEEHTSELQSRQYLVCRLLLEKKKKAVPLPHLFQD